MSKNKDLKNENPSFIQVKKIQPVQPAIIKSPYLPASRSSS